MLKDQRTDKTMRDKLIGIQKLTKQQKENINSV